MKKLILAFLLISLNLVSAAAVSQYLLIVSGKEKGKTFTEKALLKSLSKTSKYSIKQLGLDSAIIEAIKSLDLNIPISKSKEKIFEEITKKSMAERNDIVRLYGIKDDRITCVDYLALFRYDDQIADSLKQKYPNLYKIYKYDVRELKLALNSRLMKGSCIIFRQIKKGMPQQPYKTFNFTINKDADKKDADKKIQNIIGNLKLFAYNLNDAEKIAKDVVKEYEALQATKCNMESNQQDSKNTKDSIESTSEKSNAKDSNTHENKQQETTESIESTESTGQGNTQDNLDLQQ